jgi:acyl-CoA thioesterase-1
LVRQHMGHLRMKRQHGFVQGFVMATLMLVLAAGVGFSARAQGAAMRPLKLVALGDSLTAGYGLPGEAAFPAVLERALRAKGYAVSIANAGVSGDTTSGGLARLDWSVPDGTDGVILELGANDMLRGIDPNVPRQALDQILARLRDRGIPVLLTGMYASRNLGAEYVARFEAIFPDLAKKYGVPLYPFFLDGVAGVREFALPDGLHPTAKGVQVVVERILPTVERFVAQLAARPPAGG